MKPCLIALLVSVMLSSIVLPAQAQSGVEISGVAATYQYGEQVTIEASIETSAPVREAFVFIQPEGASAWVEAVTLDGSSLRYPIDLNQKPIQPFSRTEYWFRLVLEDGSEYTSDAYWFYYDDNRFTWQTLESDQFQVYWYGRDLAFGQAALNAAKAGLTQAASILPADAPAPLRIFIYSSTTDFQEAMQISPQSWIAGHASPELDTVLVSIPVSPDDELELQRQIPHELAHILQYRLTGEAYTRIPTWLLEGSASLAEPFANPDYGDALDTAVETETLIPMSQLCGVFPREASGAFLAYAQSTSFTRYLHQNYGTSGLTSLFEKYQDGVGCEEAPQLAFGAPLSELEYRWRLEVLNVDITRLVLRNLAPYLALLAVLVLIPLFGTIAFRRKKTAEV